MTAPLLSVEGVTLRYRTKEHSGHGDVPRQLQSVPVGSIRGAGAVRVRQIDSAESRRRIYPAHRRTHPIERRRGHGPGPDRVFVFQEFDQLLPWKTVKENIVFALTASGKLPRRQAEERAMHYIAKVNLTEFASSYPHTLSGGMKQRVAIARAMAMEPQILLMDEPFAALDALTRAKMQEELLQLWDETKFTVLFVTHSIPEAIRVGNRILLMSAHPGQVRAEINSSGADAARIHEILFRRQNFF